MRNQGWTSRLGVTLLLLVGLASAGRAQDGGPSGGGVKGSGATAGVRGRRAHEVPVLERTRGDLVRDGELEAALGDVARLLGERRVGDAVERLGEVSRDGLDASDTSFLTRLISLVEAVLRFENATWESLLREEERVQGLGIRLASGKAGRVLGIVAGQLEIDVGSERRHVSLAELSASSVLAIGRRRHASSEQSLWGAAFALAYGEPRAFEELLRDAARDPGLRAGIDSLLAFDRDLHPVPAGGFTLIGEAWVTAAERESIERQARIIRYVEALFAQEPAARAAARVDLALELDQSPEAVVDVLRLKQAALAEAVAGTGAWPSVLSAFERRREVERQRAHALELIFDEERYFYPYMPPACPPEKAARYAEVQREVDRRVQALRDLWGSESEDPPALLRLSKPFLDAAARLITLRSTIDELRLGRSIPPAEVDEKLALLPAGGDLVTVRNLALDAAERQRLDADLVVLDTNEKVRPEVPRNTWGQVAITNAYRRMLGRRALLLDLTLYQSARGHCEWMSRTGKFSHLADEGVGVSPFDRMKRAGFTGTGGGENISYNAGSPEAAHDRWLHSSGHHRNILWETHTHMGVAQVGPYWTQNFGGTAAYRGNLEGGNLRSDVEGLFDTRSRPQGGDRENGQVDR
ncbi:MAG: CAP domain-containing protein [Planctomycetota bacterium]